MRRGAPPLPPADCGKTGYRPATTDDVELLTLIRPGPHAGRPVPLDQRVIAKHQGVAGDPVVTVDAKKEKGPAGPHGRGAGECGPWRGRSHAFPGPATGRVIPLRVYDISADRGFASVGASSDTALVSRRSATGGWPRVAPLPRRGAGRW